jgi:DNA helicase-2/ATP-dependent DNA helicase PcrA
MPDHLAKLNSMQREAVLAIDGPLLVLAGAGSGKTRVIAHRILEIVRQGTPPEQILAITFTNKAAAEMRQRVIGLLQENQTLSSKASGAPFVSTFHSLGLLIVKENAKQLGFKRTPAIYDRADSLREIKAALKSLGVEDIEPRAALSLLSKQKGQGITAEEFAQKTDNPRARAIASAWALYEQALHKDGAVDFDDLLLRAMRFLRSDAEARLRYQKRWTRIHIDEYQDTNHVQARLAELLVGPDKHICAVGDIDQTIYGWRGAEIANIIGFERTFGGGKAVLLEENYRSTQKILAAANEIIVKNPNRPDKNLFTKNAEGEQIGLYQAFDEMDEGGFIARKIGELLEKKVAPKDIAVLYRANFQSRAIEEALLAANVPYQVLGTRFFERKEVKDVLSFVRAATLKTSADLARIANTPPRGIGKVTLLKMLSGKEHELTGAVKEKVGALHRLLSRIEETSATATPSELVRFVITSSGMEQSFKEDKLEGAEHLENLRELVSLAARFDQHADGLQAFLESAALQSDQDELKDDTNAVRLMTVHASKGLEFPYVFITGLEEGLFPYAREGGSESDMEEERRLCYVAITRAEKKVFLTYAAYRTVFGSKNPTIPSQFLSDIPDYLIELESPERLGRTIYLD